MDAVTTARRQMVEGIWTRLGLQNEFLKSVMLTVPRHLFVDSALAGKAYSDTSLPIGAEQTISQPSMVAMMSHFLRIFFGIPVTSVPTMKAFLDFGFTFL